MSIAISAMLLAVASGVRLQPPPSFDSSSGRAATSRSRANVHLPVDARHGAPSFLWAVNPATKARHAPRPLARAPGRTDAERAAREHLAGNAALYGVAPEDVASATLHAVHDTGRGVIIVELRQQIDGVPLFRGAVKVALTRELDPVAISGALAPPRRVPGRHEFRLRAADAAAAAVRDLTGDGSRAARFGAASPADGGFEALVAANETGARPLRRPVRARKVWFRLGERIEPAWHLEVSAAEVPRGSLHFGYVVSAVDGHVLFRKNLVAHVATSYRVWGDPDGARAPYGSPQGSAGVPHPTGAPDVHDPQPVDRPLVTLETGSTRAADPWLSPDASETNGNHADAFADLAPPDGFSPGDVRATATAAGVFDHPWSPAEFPAGSANQRMAAVTQAFYTANWLHDRFYEAGFDELSGNAQRSNYGRGGAEGDPLALGIQDHEGVQFSSIHVPSDGESPSMNLFVARGNGGTTFAVDAPAELARTWSAGAAAYGPADYAVSAEIVPAEAGSSPASGGCDPPQDARGKIVLVADGGDCFRVFKALRAQDAGAVALVIATDSSFTRTFGTFVEEFRDVSIPVVAISRETVDALRPHLGGAVRATVARSSTRAAVDRDEALDAQLLAHEWGHYMTNRLVGDASGLTARMARGVDEGWADFHSLLLVIREEDRLVGGGGDFAGAFAHAAYVSSGGETTGSYFGGRRYPYSTDLRKNPLTLRHIEEGVPLPPDVPVAGDPGGSGNSEEHAVGEVWATMLWECYASLLRDTSRFSFADAQSRMRDYVVAAAKLTPADATLLEARDAVLAAAYANDPLDHALFLQAFAKRGAGTRALAPERWSATLDGVVESFEGGNDLAVRASLDDDVASRCGGDGILDPGEQGTLTVTLHNVGAGALPEGLGVISTNDPAVAFLAGAEITLPPLAPMESATVTIPVGLGAGPARRVQFDLRFESGVAAGPLAVSFDVAFDVAEAVSTLDDFEAPFEQWPWTFGGGAGPSASGDFASWGFLVLPDRSRVLSAVDPRYPSDRHAVTPPLDVGVAGTFAFTFRQRHYFGERPGAQLQRWAGGVIEVSADGGASWSDVGAHAVPTYGGALSTGLDNPLEGRAAFVGASASYPEFERVTVDLGTAYAGQRVMVRFRLASGHGASPGPGWDIDDIAFQGITNAPFPARVEEPPACAAGRAN